jgi:hypothetical protein
MSRPLWDVANPAISHPAETAPNPLRLWESYGVIALKIRARELQVRTRNCWMLVALSLLGISPSLRSQPFDLKQNSAGAADTLSVMTYNVKGLPWPVAWGRDGALDAIGQRLGSGLID